MKLTKIKKSPAQRRGRKPHIGSAKRFNLYITQKILDDIAELRQRAESLGCKSPGLTCSYVLRVGARLFIKKRHKELDLVERAEYHAKKRS